jgi:YbgC/YbaW family acyl-CoA thioester hydrolase
MVLLMSVFIIEQRVAWSDVDLARIVYFPRYFSYFETAELEWIRQRGYSYESLLEELGIWMPRVAAHCDYLAPARLAELLAIEMRLDRLGKTSFTLGFDAFRLPDRTHLADGHIVIATVSRDGFRPTAVPARLEALLSELEPRSKSPRVEREGP